MDIVTPYLFILADFFLNCYSFVVVILLIISLLKNNKFKAEGSNWIYVWNTILPFVCFVCLSLYAYEAYMAWRFKHLHWYYHHNYYIERFLPLGLGLIFIFRVARRSRLMTLLFLIVFNIGWFENIYHLITIKKSSASWFYHYDDGILMIISKWLFYALLLVAVYLNAAKRNKLPYPSLFLKK